MRRFFEMTSRTPTHTSLLRCPECGHRESLEMPTDACRFFHIGAVHTWVARSAFDRFDLDALRFVGSGLAVLLIGGITLAARRVPIRGLALVANAAGLALALAFGMLTRWREPQGPLLVALFLAGGAGAAAAGPRPDAPPSGQL
ncbi:MAG TPA: hypothetical protein VKA84_02835 [Gemmatimonadaceae bacterium]|nr:hypothetical protein [Gemmatimonadaceae bacterium]